MDLVETIKREKLAALQTKATKNGFLLDEFTGFVLVEVETGCDLYFEKLNDVENYIAACDLNEQELRQHYGFVTDSEL